MPPKKFDPESVKRRVAARYKPKKATAAESARLRHDSLKELATRHLHDFVRQAWHVLEPEEPFVDNWHIRAICDHLEAVTDGRVTKLLVNVPPGTMKSLLTCVLWPAWVWATAPGKRFMYFSYAESLSLRDSVKTRDLVLSEWYQERWPLDLKEDQNAKGRFDTQAGGWRLVGSVTGKGIGEHPDFCVADDPHNVLQAESDADRESVKNWFEGVFSVRGEVRDARRVLVMQRLHAQDCSGLALDKGGWTHLCFPMRFESPAPMNDKRPVGPDNPLVPRMPHTAIGFQDPRTVDGELLWPEKYTATKVENLEAAMGIYSTAGQLQQRPTPRGGAKFKRGWFEILTAAPAMTDIVRFWDKSGTRGGTGARTAGVLMGKWTDPGAGLPAMREKFIVLDVVTCREEAAEREAIMKQTASTDRSRWGHVVTWVEQEPGSGGKESAQGTVGNLAGFTCMMERVTGSKEVRAEPFMSQASVGKVKLLEAKWNQGFLDELEHFPLGKLKDQVDAGGGAFNKLCSPTGAFGTGDGVDTAGDAGETSSPVDADSPFSAVEDLDL